MAARKSLASRALHSVKQWHEVIGAPEGIYIGASCAHKTEFHSAGSARVCEESPTTEPPKKQKRQTGEAKQVNMSNFRMYTKIGYTTRRAARTRRRPAPTEGCSSGSVNRLPPWRLTGCKNPLMAEADDKMNALQAQLTKEREKSQGNLRKLMAAMKTNKELEKELASLKEAAHASGGAGGEASASAAEAVEAKEALRGEEAARKAAEAQAAEATAIAAEANAAAKAARAEAEAARSEAKAARAEADASISRAVPTPDALGNAAADELAACRGELEACQAKLAASEAELATCQEELVCEQAQVETLAESLASLSSTAEGGGGNSDSPGGGGGSGVRASLPLLDEYASYIVELQALLATHQDQNASANPTTLDDGAQQGSLASVRRATALQAEVDGLRAAEQLHSRELSDLRALLEEAQAEAADAVAADSLTN